ncbi:PREDICTED: putative ammonium transporter sll1017 isoform X2 [Trachymyrmex cornetzi]|uniref:Putative ammonium transporter 1 n=1 Tax=Trachymyrmex cornetzi TaxID=471704 RepID=A0A195DVF5_9HYME|nr:PREDICTED: putative ammonium transporter sll1017 isoform X2 [Trachymyrmex cornetzi]KYN16863.1 Putative ammonium transporter 1 [Trachymyrmex cornetzi]
MSSVTKDYFYAENYYDYAVQPHIFGNYTAVSTTHLHWNSLIRLVLTILLRIGFVVIQIGNGPINNVNLILLQNAVDLCCVTVMYFLTGFLIAYNGDIAGLIGAGHWISDSTIDKNEAIVGWQAVAITSAICTTAIAGRMHIAGYLLVSILLSGLIQPLLIHWAWMGWMAKNELSGKTVVFKDQAGAAVIHIIGGLSGLIGCIVLGRKMFRLKGLDDASIIPGSARNVFGGLLLIFAGLQGLCTSSHEHDKYRMFARDSSHAYVNNLLAASSCTLIIVALHFVLDRDIYDHWTLMRCIQGTIAGVIMVSAAPNDYSPQVAIVLGSLGGIVFHFVSTWIFHSTLEDYCNVVAVHFICAILGSILAPICAMRTDEDTMTILLNFSWQLISLAALLALVGTAMLLIFSIMECCGILCNRSECLNHARGNAAVDRALSRSFLQKLFSPNSGCLYLDSTSNTGHHPCIDFRFSKYQEKINKLEEERPTVTNQQNVNVKIEANVTKIPMPVGARVKKVRQVHTLSGSTPALIENKGGTGESIGKDLSEIGGKRFLGKEIKCTLDPIEEIDEEILKEFEIEKNSVQFSIDGFNAGDKNLISEYFNVSGDRKNLNESNYQLRRTIKFMNLHHEFVKEDLKVVLGPNCLDSSSSDSCDDDIILAKTSDLNESIKDIAINKDSLIYSANIL